MSLRWSQRVLKTSMGGPVCRPYVLKRFPHGERPQGSPLRRIQKLSLRFVGAGHWPARRCTRRVREAAPYKRRTLHCGRPHVAAPTANKEAIAFFA